MIPSELRQYAQWLVSGPSKVPISPKTGHAADVRDKTLYATYDEAVLFANGHGYDIGFALTREDPFVCIDLDNPENETQRQRHTKIFESFNTYAELSRSGTGVHIWCLSENPPPRGVRRDKVEVYPHDRYIICTGTAIKPLPVQPCTELLTLLFEEMDRGGYGSTDLEEIDEIQDDEDVLEMAMHAANADKFNRLCSGHWQDEYPSQSEADFALMDMLCFYTRSNEQAKRLFRYSSLGRRSKAQREEYLNAMIRKIRAEELPMVDFSGLKPNGSNGAHDVLRPYAVESTYGTPVQQETTTNKPTLTETNLTKPRTVEADFTLPPGFMGEIAQYIYQTSTRPVAEVATAAALAMMAGIMGRQFNISGTGLNQYIILLAKTGVGKEDGPRGIERILSAVRSTIPVVDQFMGPGTFASGQAIIRTLDERPCIFSILGEFGLTLQDLSDVNANSLSRVMRRAYLDLWSKSGRYSVLPESAYSDKQKNTRNLYAPALTLLGESTPETFYEGLNLHHIESGLIPRFLIIEYTGDRTSRNPGAFAPPPAELVQRMSDLIEIPCRMQANQTWVDVQLDEKSKAVLDAFDNECDRRIRSGANEAVRQLWNRAHLKALRLSGLLAVVDRPHVGEVNEVEAEWAVQLVRRDTERLAEKFMRGDVGEGISKQVADMEAALVDFVKRPLKEIENYGVTQKMKELNVVPAAYLQRRLLNKSAFRKDRRGAPQAFRETISALIEYGTLEPLPKLQAKQLFNSGASFFKVNRILGV